MATPPLAVDYQASWSDRLLDGLYEQFKNDPSWQAWCTQVLAPQAQAIEEAQQQLLTILSIKYGAGLQLDRIGRIVGRGREGQPDAIYQQMLYAQVLVNRSGGTGENLYAVFSALLGPGALPLLWIPGWPANLGTPGQGSFELRALGIVSDVLGTIATEFLGDAKRQGVRGLLEWQAQADSLTFFTAQGAGLISASLAGATSLNVDASTFPASGSVTIDAGIAGSSETATYTVTDATHIAVSALANPHSIGAAVEVVGDPGQGFSIGSGVSGGASPGDTTLTLQETSGFPASGQVVVDFGMGNQETLTYSSILANTLMLVGTVGQAHLTGAAVQVVGTNTGGAFANGLQA